jgi:leucyl aminopeptidase
MTPKDLEEIAKKIARQNKIKITILGKKEMQKKKMNAILGVSKGSSQEPKLIILEINPIAKEKIAIVGKGITFDSGGLDLKPAAYMLDMKSDMAGAATVLNVMDAIAKLKPKKGIIGVIAASENMTGQSAQKPGDIITSYNKKTIEIINTDAEGRLVLADAISYVKEQKKPSVIIDVATLTGASIIALGYTIAAMVGNDEILKEELKKASQKSGEKIWDLPLYDEHRESMKGDISDLRNLAKGNASAAGVITAAAFIENFVEKTPWAHIDIGGAGWMPEENDYYSKGGSGYGVRLLVEFLENWNCQEKIKSR